MSTKHGFCVYVTDGDTGDKTFLQYNYSPCWGDFEYDWVSEFDHRCVFEEERYARSAIRRAGGKEQAIVTEVRYTLGLPSSACFKPSEDEGCLRNTDTAST